jgi:hypothetical protein
MSRRTAQPAAPSLFKLAGSGIFWAPASASRTMTTIQCERHMLLPWFYTALHTMARNPNQLLSNSLVLFWRRDRDSNTLEANKACKLQILHCLGCHDRHECQGCLPDVARCKCSSGAFHGPVFLVVFAFLRLDRTVVLGQGGNHPGPVVIHRSSTGRFGLAPTTEGSATIKASPGGCLSADV